MGFGRIPRAASVSALLALLLAVAGFGGAFLPARSAPAQSGARLLSATASPASIRAYVTWDGTNISTAPSDGSGLSTNLASTIQLRYYWSSTGEFNISDARLQMFYFGFALSTRDVLNQNPHLADNGTFTMTWAAGAVAYLLEGNYRLTASLLDPNGTTEWSQDFFVRAAAPFDVLAAIPIILILIAIYEIYGLLTSGRHAKPSTTPRKTSPKPASPPSPPASPSDASKAPPSPETPPEGET